jgi:hypothetical protein
MLTLLFFLDVALMLNVTDNRIHVLVQEKLERAC